MSNGARIFLGVALLVIALGFLALVPFFVAAGDAFPPAAPYGLGGFALLSGLGAVACLARASHPVTIRLIGASVFLICLAYVGSELVKPTPPPAKPAENAIQARLDRRSRPSLVNSLLFFGLVGLPSGYAAIKGRYPGWGRHARAFGGGGDRGRRL
jgi:hypothetical protein